MTWTLLIESGRVCNNCIPFRSSFLLMPTTQRNTYIGISFAVLAAFIWSGNFIIAKSVNRQIPPVSLAFYRWLLASVIIFPFAAKQFKKEWPAVKRSWHYLFWASLTGVALFNTLVYVGAHHTSAINLTLIGTTTSPIVATVLARIFIKEEIGWMRLAGLLFCIAGVLFLLAKGDWHNLLTLTFSAGDLWVMTAACCFAVYNTLVKKKPISISPLNFLFVIFSIGTLLLLPFFLWETDHTAAITWNSGLLLSIIYLGLGASVICFWIWNIAISKIGAARTILFGNLIPVFGTIGSVVYLHEQFTRVHVTGMIIVFTGIILANLRNPKRV
ncbi:MAG: DMT family transporter [Chitinophagaceae bacterium]|nr:DMT family transporter [Chitinophagaceae bacterium]